MEKCPNWCAKWHIKCISCEYIIHKGQTTRKITIRGTEYTIHSGCQG